MSGRTAWLVGLFMLAALGLAGVPLVGAATPEDRAPAMPVAAPGPSPPPRPVDPNDAWFVTGDPGTAMKANEVIDDPGLFPLYFDDAEARVYRRHGVDVVRMRSYYAGAQGGATLKVVPTHAVDAVLRGLDRLGPGLGRRYPALPRGHIRRTVVQMESTRAHDVFAHFYTITFAEGPYVVTVEAYGTAAPVGRRRAVTYAQREHELLARRGPAPPDDA